MGERRKADGRNACLTLGFFLASMLIIRRLRCMMREWGTSIRYVKHSPQVISPWGIFLFQKKNQKTKSIPYQD